jgi:hypothetical protein
MEDEDDLAIVHGKGEHNGQGLCHKDLISPAMHVYGIMPKWKYISNANSFKTYAVPEIKDKSELNNTNSFADIKALIAALEQVWLYWLQKGDVTDDNPKGTTDGNRHYDEVNEKHNFDYYCSETEKIIKESAQAKASKA